ncbi:hypothetical protein ACHAPC_001881 [Botrytis cinerea]
MTTTSTTSLSPVLITGGCGFIGFHLVNHILESEPTYEIHVLDINTTRNRVLNATYHTCDITSLPGVDSVMLQAQPRTIFHFACPDSMVLQPSVFQKVNVNGAQNLISAALKVGTAQAFRVYTLTKAVAEAEILAANRNYGDSSMLNVSLRPATAFGERDTICMGKIVDVCRQGNGKFQIGPGKIKYDFIYVSNLSEAHILAAQALLCAFRKPVPPLETRVDGRTLNITNDQRILFWEFQRRISAVIGFPIKEKDIKIIPKWLALPVAVIGEYSIWIRSFGNRQPSVTRESVRLTTIIRTLNGDKARRVLGYTPKVSILEGIKRSGKWFVEEAKQAEDGKKVN